jgi:hypothetical protein
LEIFFLGNFFSWRWKGAKRLEKKFFNLKGRVKLRFLLPLRLKTRKKWNFFLGNFSSWKKKLSFFFYDFSLTTFLPKYNIIIIIVFL